MPFMEMTVVDDRKEFILHLEGRSAKLQLTMSGFRISRPTGISGLKGTNPVAWKTSRIEILHRMKYRIKHRLKLKQAIIEIRKKHKLFGPRRSES